jgi:hypothetical protein
LAVGGASGLPPIQTAEPIDVIELARRAAFMFAKARIQVDQQKRESLRLAAPEPAVTGYGSAMFPGGKPANVADALPEAERCKAE